MMERFEAGDILEIATMRGKLEGKPVPSPAHETFPWTACNASEDWHCVSCGELIRGVVFIVYRNLWCEACANKEAQVGTV